MSLVEVIAWLVAHAGDLVTAVTGIVTAASVIVRLTPTTRDDQAVAPVVRTLETLSLARRKPAVVASSTADRADAMQDALERGDVAKLRELVDGLDDEFSGRR